jgi:resolvase-like protein
MGCYYARRIGQQLSHGAAVRLPPYEIGHKPGGARDGFGKSAPVELRSIATTEAEQSCRAAGRESRAVQLGQREAIYCRVSTPDESCDRSDRDRTAFAARAGYEVIGIFTEISSRAKLDQAERKRVMSLAQRRESDAVWWRSSPAGDAARSIW